MKFNGTLVITDPCYFVSEGDWDYVISEGSRYLNRLDRCKMIADKTGIGDWSCNVIDKNTGSIIGEFAADAGMVYVTTLEEIERYNPDKVQHLREIPWCCFILPNFNGEAWFTIDDNNYRIVNTAGSHRLVGGMLYTWEEEDE